MQFDTFMMVAASGVLATYILIVGALCAPRIGLPQINFGMGMADLYWGTTFEGKPPYWAAFFSICVNGILFALIYATWVGALLPGPDIVRGVIWGVILYLGAELIFVPIFLRGGVFSVKAGPMAWATSLVVHVLWGGIVGWLCPVL